MWSELRQRGVTVLGVSPDSVESHIKFAREQDLPFLLLADESAQVAQAYGVWVEKTNYGRTYMGIARTTFYIRPDGVIGYVWENVKPNGHGQEVRDYLKAQLP